MTDKPASLPAIREAIEKLRMNKDDIPQTPFNIAIEMAYNEAITDVLALVEALCAPGGGER